MSASSEQDPTTPTLEDLENWSSPSKSLQTRSEHSEASSSTHNQDEQLPLSSSTLRFPQPQGDNRVNFWVESISGTRSILLENERRHTQASNMPSSVSDEGMLGDSTYEFIDTDTESRDGGATESVASTDFGARPDDVASLADTEGSDESEDEDEEDEEPPAVVEQAFNTPTIGRSNVILDEADKPLAQSEIQFEEVVTGDLQTVSVKHTVADLNEEQTSEANLGLGMHSLTRPKRVQVTVRQTMTKAGLSTKEPLNILYVGSHSARQDIIHKIGSSVTASVGNGKDAQRRRISNSQIYNVVPVSAFGSEKTPEVELMQGSGYQLKVQDCGHAQSSKLKDDSTKEVIVLVLDGATINSIPMEEGYTIEPAWELPHVAIFYCSDSDDVQARTTRTLARKFMGRHEVPSIVISHKQLLGRSQCMSLDQHSIHMCLESRGVIGKGNIIHRRLPIDLASFLNIDARQMNRNLAYLTGLHESHSRASVAGRPKKFDALGIEHMEFDDVPFKKTILKLIQDTRALSWRTLVTGLLVLGSVLFSTYSRLQATDRTQSNPSIVLNSKVMSADPVSSTSLLTLTSSVMSATSTPRVSIATSTRTVTVTQSAAPKLDSISVPIIKSISVPDLKSISVVPTMDLGKLRKPTTQSKPSNKSATTAEILGDREILIRIPSANSLVWGNREAININITRLNNTVEPERFLFINEGIILLLPKKEAYGVLNVSIITTKKPRVNESFELDFGSEFGRAWAEMKKNIGAILPDIDVDHIKKEAAHLASQSETALKVISSNVLEKAETLASVAKALSFEAAKRSAILSKELGIRASDASVAISTKVQELMKGETKKKANEVVLAAQVRSKILWLKAQGKVAEAEEYERKAVESFRKGKGKREEKVREKKVLRADGKKLKRGDRVKVKKVKGEA